MDAPSIADLARLINASATPRGVLYLTGGGTEVLPMLLAQGGGSSTLLSARIPYDPADLGDLLGPHHGPAVSEKAARGLAMAAFRRALSLRGDLGPGEVFGLGATSKLARVPTERDGRSHEVHAALQTSAMTLVRSAILPTGIDRAAEERINALLLLNLLAQAKGVDRSVPLDHDARTIDLDERLGDARTLAGLDLRPLYEDRVGWIGLDLAYPGREVGEAPRLLLPGSFRPFHEGHRGMAEAAAALEGTPCGFEVSLFHPEKPPLDHLEVAERLRGFGGIDARVYLTNAPTYVEKARLFPGCVFVVGHDTALRVIDPRFYGGRAARDAMLREFDDLGTRFLVFGRVDGAGRFRNVTADDGQDDAVVAFLGRRVRTVAEEDFRLDLSSTEIRRRLGMLPL